MAEIKKVKEVKSTKAKKVVVASKKVDTKAKVKTASKTSEVLAKAGKRSAKAVKETEAKVTKKAKAEVPQITLKLTKKPTRPKEERAGKKYRELAKLIDKTKTYELAEALELATKTSPTKFDATVELHVKLGVDPKVADQNIRNTVALPAGSGKTVKVAVLVDGDEAVAAKKAGADLTDVEAIFAQLDKEQINFDSLIATPTMMAQLAKYAKLLGPRGLMPSPKSGTVTTDVVKAVTEAKAGKVEYRVDQDGIVHLGVGKISQGNDNLLLNTQAVIDSIKSAKPASLKGIYIQTAYVTTSMGPSIRTSLS